MEIGYVKTLKADDGKEIKLVGNALTFILYKNYFGRDLLNDIIIFACKNNNENVLKEIKKLADNEHNVVYNMDRLTEEQQVKVLNSISNYTFDSEFVLNLIATLMATAKYPEKVDIIDMIVQIPPYFLCDREIISSLMDFLVKFTQKKSQQASIRIKK